MATCRKCGGQIDWELNQNNKLIPVNAGGHEPHFGVCKKRQLGEGEDYFGAYGGSHKHAPRRHPVSGREMYSKGRVASEHRSKGEGPEYCCPDVPPWEYCQHQLEDMKRG